MRISVDADQCNGHGRCYAVSPEAYAPDDEGYCADRGRSREIAARLEAAARQARKRARRNNSPNSGNNSPNSGNISPNSGNNSPNSGNNSPNSGNNSPNSVKFRTSHYSNFVCVAFFFLFRKPARGCSRCPRSWSPPRAGAAPRRGRRCGSGSEVPSRNTGRFEGYVVRTEGVRVRALGVLPRLEPSLLPRCAAGCSCWMSLKGTCSFVEPPPRDEHRVSPGLRLEVQRRRSARPREKQTRWRRRRFSCARRDCGATRSTDQLRAQRPASWTIPSALTRDADEPSKL